MLPQHLALLELAAFFLLRMGVPSLDSSLDSEDRPILFSYKLVSATDAIRVVARGTRTVENHP